jgi:hypothetical protein
MPGRILALFTPSGAGGHRQAASYRGVMVAHYDE